MFPVGTTKECPGSRARLCSKTMVGKAASWFETRVRKGFMLCLYSAKQAGESIDVKAFIYSFIIFSIFKINRSIFHIILIILYINSTRSSSLSSPLLRERKGRQDWMALHYERCEGSPL